MTYTRDLIRTIGRNAGKVPKHVMANMLGISVSFLERIARDNGYDLRLIEERGDPNPATITSAHDPTPRPLRREAGSVRSVNVTTTLWPRDVDAIDAVGAKLGLRRGRVVSRIIEAARDKGTLLELARLPAPTPQKEEGA